MKIKNIKVFSTILLLSSLIITPVNADRIIIGEPIERKEPIVMELENYPKWFQVQEGSLFIEELWNVLENYPINIDGLFKKYGIKIVLVTEDGYLEDKYDQFGVRGIFSQRDRSAFIETYVDKKIIEKYLDAGVSPELLEGYTNETLSLRVHISTMIHETTHAVDYLFSYVSESEEFTEIFNEEWESYKLTTHYNFENRLVVNNINEPREFLASAMVSYVLYPEELQRYCPKTYNFISKLILSINNLQEQKTK